MKVKKSNLKWYVLKYDPNLNQIINYNVMIGLAEILHKKIIFVKYNLFLIYVIALN